LKPELVAVARKRAGSPKRDRGLDGASAQELPLIAPGRTQHWVIGENLADTDRRSLEASAPRLTRKPPAIRISRTDPITSKEGEPSENS
jgi:hypothetical protein